MNNWEKPATCKSSLQVQPQTHLQWAIDRWRAEVANRPLKNIHRRSLDDTWRQVIRHHGGDDEALVGPCHDDLLAQANE